MGYNNIEYIVSYHTIMMMMMIYIYIYEYRVFRDYVLRINTNRYYRVEPLDRFAGCYSNLDDRSRR